MRESASGHQGTTSEHLRIPVQNFNVKCCEEIIRLSHRGDQVLLTSAPVLVDLRIPQGSHDSPEKPQS